MARKKLEKIDTKELSRAAFEDGLATLRTGHIPGNMDNIKTHINDTTKELVEYVKAVTECAIRQNAQIELLQSIIDAGKKAGMVGKGEGG